MFYTMKKIIASVFAAAMLLMGTEAFAQLVPGAGYLLSIEKSKSENSDLDAIKLNGFYVGASYNIPLVGGLGVAPGLYADMLFYNGAATVREIVTFTEHYTELALNLPVNLNYQFEVSDNASIYAFAGPVFQVGLVARSTYNGRIDFGPIHINEGEAYNHYNSENGDMNRFNIYLGGGLGFQIGDILLTVGYDHNLLNVDKTEGWKTNRNQIKVGVNFAF
ncbi:MAG: porin family protein [Bacteroidales bacterium]|nr:porin family protein [Bacteroidales bacterium]